MAPRETQNNASSYAKFFGDKKKSVMVCYGIFWSGPFNTQISHNTPCDKRQALVGLLILRFGFCLFPPF